ncbi:AIR carboxylase [Rubripirellula tenax]|uniref:AIR carboxylase n=1 Tax=Rubripirellula tenax TaxID=2528015 RepID=A0A5C6FH28_9BACT|nr:nickel pincer cofactor biosynthesis protein LarB [Rubripirellula tenax]TWU59474.1 AIR carboxylase [Rubripirellula tenax]
MPEPLPCPSLVELLSEVIAGRASLDELTRQIAISRDPVGAIDGATIDLGRRNRCGFSEVIYGQGKSADLITRIITTQIAAGEDALVTRIDGEIADRVAAGFPHTHVNRVGRTLRVSTAAIEKSSTPDVAQEMHAAVITAGSTDRPVAEEAIETLQWMGVPVARYDDIGVAGPQRLLAAVPNLRHASAVVVIAGMEGALPSVVAGHLAVPIFAVPTSVGYGASLGGLTPLLGMLSACASNVAVVNIDAGFKGGYLAGMVVSQLRTLRESKS